MKKSILLLTLMLVTLIPGIADAQSAVTKSKVTSGSLIGTWVTKDKSMFGDDADMFSDVDIQLAFKSDAAAQMKVALMMEKEEDGMNISMGMVATIPATYKRNGNVLSLKADKKNAKIELTNIDIDLPAELEAQLKAVGMTKQSLIDMIKGSINTQEFANELGTLTGDMNIVTLTKTTLVVSDDDGTEIKFTRK